MGSVESAPSNTGGDKTGKARRVVIRFSRSDVIANTEAVEALPCPGVGDDLPGLGAALVIEGLLLGVGPVAAVAPERGAPASALGHEVEGPDEEVGVQLVEVESLEEVLGHAQGMDRRVRLLDYTGFP